MQVIAVSAVFASLSFFVLLVDSERCQRAPSWTIGGLDPMAEARSKGHVVLLGLLLASCRFCQWQASKMQEMYEEMFVQKNTSDVSFMILNMKRAASSINELKVKVSFPVYQESATDVMQLLKGKKDDMLVYNRCGLLVDHFTKPQSYLGYQNVRNSLERVINRKSGCPEHCVETTPAATKPVSTNQTSSAALETVTSQAMLSNATTALSPTTHAQKRKEQRNDV